MESTYDYFAEGPKCLVNSCDILLRLDDHHHDGTRLPAHSHVLARFSPVFAGLLDGGSLSGASREHQVELPVTDCSREEAIPFLSVLYSASPDKRIDQASAMSSAKLAHRFGMQVLIYIASDFFCS